MGIFWLIMLYYLIHLVQIVLASAVEISFSWFLCLFDMNLSMFCVVLLSGTTPGSSCTPPALVLESTVSPGILGSFDWRRALDPKI